MTDLQGLWRDPAIPVELRTTTTSPFGRKVRMAAITLGLAERMTLRSADTRDPSDDLRRQNPLGRIPCLMIGNEAFYDSGVILELLDSVAGGGLLPTAAHPLARLRALTQGRLADGITEAALLMVYEYRFREPGQVSDIWLNHQRGKILRALSVFETAPPPVGRADLVSIGLAAALGYLDWRQPVAWRDNYHALSKWLDNFAGAVPAYLQTESDDR